MNYESKNQNQNSDFENEISSESNEFDSKSNAKDATNIKSGVLTEDITQEKGGYENSAEPTRYGDWEIAGRCIDF